LCLRCLHRFIAQVLDRLMLRRDDGFPLRELCRLGLGRLGPPAQLGDCLILRRERLVLRTERQIALG